MADIAIPCPLLVTVDDVGWWLGWDGSADNQPFRTGMQRRHVPQDYMAIAELGRQLDMRIPVGFVVCEWDKDGLLRKLPSATWMGDQWQAPATDPLEKEAALSIIKDAAGFIEPALHGVGHEFWTGGRMSRSEFHTARGIMRDRFEVERHLDCFFRIMAQNGLDGRATLFIPPALHHGFGAGDSGFQAVAAGFGIRYVSLVFKKAMCYRTPQYGTVGWENNVVLMDRGPSPVAWNTVASVPCMTPDQPIVPLHWANILDHDPGQNMSRINAWASHIKAEIKAWGMVPARDFAQCLTQYLHRTRSRVRQAGAQIVVDMAWIKNLPSGTLSDGVFFKMPNKVNGKFNIRGAEVLKDQPPSQAGFLKLTLPPSGNIVFERPSPGI